MLLEDANDVAIMLAVTGRAVRPEKWITELIEEAAARSVAASLEGLL